MKKKHKASRILCKKEGYHTLLFHGDGSVLSSGCGDVTEAAKRISGTIALGKPIMEDSCAGLAALVLHGIPTLFKQPPMGDGEYIQWGAWRDLYQRFEDNKLVVAAVKRERRALRKREREHRAQTQA